MAEHLHISEILRLRNWFEGYMQCKEFYELGKHLTRKIDRQINSPKGYNYIISNHHPNYNQLHWWGSKFQTPEYQTSLQLGFLQFFRIGWIKNWSKIVPSLAQKTKLAKKKHSFLNPKWLSNVCLQKVKWMHV